MADIITRVGIRPDWPLFCMDPNICIDCGACVAKGPAGVILPESEVPAQYTADIDDNRRFFGRGPGDWPLQIEHQRSRVAAT